MISWRIMLVLVVAWAWAEPVVAGTVDLVAIDFDTGGIFHISTSDASVTSVGSTGLTGMGSLELGTDGFLYGFTTGDAPNPGYYRIDPVSFVPTLVGNLDIGFVFDGALVFAPDGTIYGTNQDNSEPSQLFTIDGDTGEATLVGAISGGMRDINGMAWRADGMLVGLDRITNALIAIDPLTAVSSLIAFIIPTVGTVGGMAVLGDTAYFVTSGPGEPVPGSNELYAIDLFTGDHELIGSLAPTITGTGISGLAVPEPSTMLLLMGVMGVVCRRRAV